MTPEGTGPGHEIPPTVSPRAGAPTHSATDGGIPVDPADRLAAQMADLTGAVERLADYLAAALGIAAAWAAPSDVDDLTDMDAADLTLVPCPQCAHLGTNADVAAARAAGAPFTRCVLCDGTRRVPAWAVPPCPDPPATS